MADKKCKSPGKALDLDALERTSQPLMGSAIAEASKASRIVHDHMGAVAKALAPVFAARRTMLDGIRQTIVVGSEFRATLAKIQAAAPEIGREVRRVMETIAASARYVVEEIPPQMRDGLIAMAKMGWHPDAELPIVAITRFEERFQDLTAEELSEWIADYYRGKLDRILNELKSRHPTRAKILQRAFDAHRGEHYDLSIPVLLIQADGICFDVTECQLYSKNPKEGLSDYFKAQQAEVFHFAMLSPLMEDMPITQSKRSRGDDFDGLNRHQILHGEVVNYGTEINSLKAISYINYVSSVLRRRNKAEDGEAEVGVEGGEDLPFTKVQPAE